VYRSAGTLGDAPTRLVATTSTTPTARGFVFAVIWTSEFTT